jgi:hypothetical protein
MSPFYRLQRIDDISRVRPYCIGRYINNDSFNSRYDGTATQYSVVHGSKNEMLRLSEWLFARTTDEAKALAVRFEGDTAFLYNPESDWAVEDTEELNFFQAIDLAYHITDFFKEEEDEWARKATEQRNIGPDIDEDGLP